MKIIILTLVALAMALGIGTFGDRGYVLINFLNHTMETSFVVFVFLVALTLWLGKILLQFSLAFILSPKRALNWRQERRLAKEKDLLMAGFGRLAEGRWEDAEKLLSRYANKSKFKSLAYLGAAWSAEKLGHHEMSQNYLTQAKEHSEHGNIASELAQIQFDIEKQRFQKALASLKALDKKHQKHPQVIRMTLQAGMATGHWRDVEHTLKPAIKLHVISNNEAEQYKLNIAFGKLKDASKSGSLEAFESAWSSFPNALRSHPKLVNHYAQLLGYHQHQDHATNLLLRQLDQDLDDDCLMTLARTQLSSPEKVLGKIERWLAKRPHDDILLLAGGLIAKQAKIWGKAKSLIESSVKHRPNADNHLALAELLEEMEEDKLALNHYRKSISMMKNHLPAAI